MADSITESIRTDSEIAEDIDDTFITSVLSQSNMDSSSKKKSKKSDSGTKGAASQHVNT